MTNQFSELELVEKTAIWYFQDLWWKDCFIDAFTKQWESKLWRKHTWEVVLTKYLKQAIIDLNPWIEENTINQVIDIFTQDQSNKNLVVANQEIYNFMKNWVKVDILQDNGTYEKETIHIIDWEDEKNNNFLLVSQMWIAGDLYQRRPDLIWFINGIPIILIELKSANKNLFDAFFDNLRDYKDTIPQIFWYNSFLILSNGIENKIWTISSWYEHFSTWKKIQDEQEENKSDLKTLIYGTCEKTRFLDLIENFTLFDNSKWSLVKILAKYHQYLWVNNAMQNVKDRKKLDGKLWVFWHTQWSGKSFSMMFFANKILRKLPWNFTFVIVTDRQELDKQIYKWFVETGIATEKNIQAESISHLKQLLTQDHRFIFSLIHKFQFEWNVQTINDRDDIIVITDEAHRTQYGELAMNMNIALPNANFIWFTGTPLIADDAEKTKEVFGDYVSVYNFSQSVQDGATVPIYYENRVPQVQITNQDLENDLETMIEKYDLDDEESEKLENEFSTAYEVLTRDDRLETIAKDIVYHFVNKWNDGKAMVVSIDKKTTVRLYEKVKKYFKVYKQELEKKKNLQFTHIKQQEIQKQLDLIEKLDMAVVLSLWNNQNEIDNFKQIWIDFKPIRERILNEDLETKFKKTDSNLKLVFVCSMWITGFDVPNITTLYLDKLLKNHTLMQTIARTNRVFEEKTNWLIVDYIWVFNNLRKALSVYASSYQEDQDIVADKNELIIELQESIDQLKSFLQDLDIKFDKFLESKNGNETLELINDFVDTIFEKEEYKKKFKKLAWKVESLYNAILPDLKAKDFQGTVKIINFLSQAIKEKWFDKSNVEQVKQELSSLMDKSIKTEDFTIQENYNYKDLSQLPFDTLKDYFSKSKKHIETDKLKSAIEEKLEDMIRKNPTRRKFMDRLNEIIWEYNQWSKNVDDLFEELIDLARSITEEEKRAVKEDLNEEQLSMFDLLYKDWITPKEEKQIKKLAQELMDKIKEKLVLDWRKDERKRADVQVAIEDFLFYNLPSSYNQSLIEEKSRKIFNHVYESYIWVNESVYG